MQSVRGTRWRAPGGAAAGQSIRVGLAGLALVVLLPVALWGTAAYRFLLGEDRLYEWLQVACLATAAAVLGAGARRARPSRRRTVLAGVALAAAVVVGEELAWGTRLLNLSVEPVQSVNLQHEATLHNVRFGLEASFFGMAAVSTVLAVWQAVRGNLELACWFAVPAVYGLVRVVVGTTSYEAAKLSEAAELAFAVAAVRLAWAVTRRPSLPS